MTKTCSRCGEMLPLDEFYYVSKAQGTRRGQCKHCMSIVKAMQKDQSWRPSCARCEAQMDRFGPGRRLCRKCFEDTYDDEQRANGSHRAKLNPCSACGAKRLRVDHVPGTSLCPICRSVPQHRRKSLRLYNLTPREYLELLDDQSYCCWICRRPFTKDRVPHVDHRHTDLLVRGLVCATDNTILALAREEPDRLRGAAKYLEAPPAVYVIGERLATLEANRRDFQPLKRVWSSDPMERAA